MDVLKVLLVVVICGHAALASCPDSEQIECGTSSRCTRIRYICDRDNDCGDGSDEESDLCNAWRNDQCERGQVKCRRFGSNDCMAISRYCELEDPPCEGDLDRRICQMMADEKLQPLHSIVLPTSEGERLVEQSTVEAVEELGEEFLVQVESTLRHPDCPDLYTRVGEHCVSIFFIGHTNWGEARAFCKTIGGDLMTFTDNAEEFHTLVHHLHDHHVTSDFWIGGHLKNETLGWTWVDDRHMAMGTPFWAVRDTEECQVRTITIGHNTTREVNDGACYGHVQAPEHPPVGHCAALTYGNYFYISDELCLSYKSPLCVANTEAH